MRGNGVARDQSPDIRTAMNKGYIIVPNGVDRNEYIETCLRTQRVSILVEGGGGVMHNCILSNHILQDIIFPENNITVQEEGAEILGSGIIFFQEPYSGIIVIIAIIPKQDDLIYSSENVTKFFRTKNGKYASITIDGNSGSIIINSDGGVVGVNVKGRESSLEVVSEGSVNVSSEKNITIFTTNDIVLESLKTTQIKPEKFMVGEGEHPIPLGDELKDQLEKLSTRVDNIVDVLKNNIPSAALHPNPAWSRIINPIVSLWQKESFDGMNSELSFTD